jgi:hypothetical protein
LAAVTGPQKGGTFYASVSWLNGAGQEGAASAASSLSVPDGQIMTVSASELPDRAVGFNVYAGGNLNALFQQNTTALPPGGSFLFVPGATVQGRLPGQGQQPDFVRPLVRTLLRG